MEKLHLHYLLAVYCIPSRLDLSLCKKEKISEEVFLTFSGGGDNLNKEGGGELLM